MKIISEEIEILPTPITHNSLGPDSPIETRYRELTPGSSELALMADSLFPSGVTHDSRYLLPYGIYVDRALGPYKWDRNPLEIPYKSLIIPYKSIINKRST